MNHYQRLKVAHDAPAEVIRAAYRALATRVHPDRQSAATSPDDLQHIEMAALNAAYETLIDPKLRADYDATLAPNAARANPWSAPAVEPTMGAEAGVGQINLDWLGTRGGQPAPTARWRPDPKMLMAGGAAALVVVLLGGAGLWHVFSQRQVDEALTRQYHDHGPSSQGLVQNDAPGGGLATGEPRPAPRPVPRTVGHKPSVEELSRMSDEELLKALPALDDEAPGARKGGDTPDRAASQSRHPLDGTPLRLRVERELVDPLAAAPGQGGAGR